jgi:hypothetical protein
MQLGRHADLEDSAEVSRRDGLRDRLAILLQNLDSAATGGDGKAPLKVAAAIDGSHWEELAGTIAGNNSVMLLTESQSSQDLLMDRLKLFADRYRKPRGGAGVSGALPGG